MDEIDYQPWPLAEAIEYLREQRWLNMKANASVDPMLTVLDAAAEVESLRSAVARVREVCKPDLDWSERSGEDLPMWVTEILRALDGET